VNYTAEYVRTLGDIVNVAVSLVPHTMTAAAAASWVQQLDDAASLLAIGECVPLAVELQLLVAAECEHWQQQANPTGHRNLFCEMLHRTNFMLLTLLDSCYSVQHQQGVSRLQQLLQGPEPPLLLALAAPLQHLPSETCPGDVPGEQLLALKAAESAAKRIAAPGRRRVCWLT
jgi:hypothetical protein